ncbi:CFI-box-CTERM domain-containing protein [Methanobrevibacter curvatus]|uniref:Uncharacterized protein n=1 Tax=Methanobrevibacter curvatus TaxID=49547 RepID=A0A166ELM2_9EURY|nr:CFI-box-CTERM domain-containing protein [Methanobrevibacter curvatus]KZX16791.1 hypothetical protein MBCUR_00300 [Methanobrevibacter curvatus]
MEEIVCEVCGSKDIKKRGKLHSCNSCGSEYLPETIQDSNIDETEDIFTILGIEDLRNENLSDTEELFESSFDFRNEEGEVLDEESMEMIFAYLDDLKVKFLEKTNLDGNKFKNSDLEKEPLKTEFLEYVKANIVTIDKNNLNEHESDKKYYEDKNRKVKNNNDTNNNINTNNTNNNNKNNNNKNRNKNDRNKKYQNKNNQIIDGNAKNKNNLKPKIKSENDQELNNKEFLTLIVDKKYFDKEIYKKYTEFSEIINKNTSKNNSKNINGNNNLNLEKWEKDYYNGYLSAYNSTISDFKLNDAIIYFKRGIEKLDGLNNDEKKEELKFDFLDLVNGLGNWTLDCFNHYHFEEELETLILNLKESINALDETLAYFSQEIVEVNDEIYISYTSILKWSIEICRDHFYLVCNERNIKEKVERGKPQFYFDNQYKNDSQFSDFDQQMAETNNELRKFAIKNYDNYLEKIKKINPSFKDEKIKKSDNGGCYIATAIYGSYNSYEVLILREFRDKILFNNIFGRAFINLYYFLSPKIVKLFGNKKFFNLFFKGILDKIIIQLRKKYL